MFQEFRPYFRGNWEKNFSFLRHNVTKIIPSGAQLQEYAKLEEEIKIDIHAGAMLNLIGVPENIKRLIQPLPGIDSKKAYDHLIYVTDPEVKGLLASGLDIDEEDDAQWYTLVYAYLLRQWFNPANFDRLILFTPVTFDPSTLLFDADKTSNGWKMIIGNKVKPFLDRSGMDKNYQDRYTAAEKMIKAFHFYGAQGNFYSELKFHHYLQDSCVFELVGSYLNNQDKQSIHITSSLMALYMPIHAIQKAAKCLN